MKFLSFVGLLIFVQTSAGQIVTWDPLFPTVDDTITIVYDATQGNRGLLDATEVYAHTGVLISTSSSGSDWKHVKTTWGENTPETKLRALGNKKWQIAFHIKSYYGISPNEKIPHLAFVFRNGNCTMEGKTESSGDIFIPIFERGFQVTLLKPVQKTSFMNIDDSLNIVAVGAHSAYLSLFMNDSLIVKENNDTLKYTHIISGPEPKNFEIVAEDSGGAQKSISFSSIVNPAITYEERPEGMQDGINYLSNSKVHLSIYAPFKQFAYVIGAFTNWEVNPQYYMKKTPDGKRFWMMLDGLDPNREYIFQYYIDGKIKIADPYTEKTSDPRFDKYISSSTYPGLLSYPENKTTGIASVLQTAQVPYDWNITNFEKPNKENLIIYECLLRDFLQNHDFKTLTDTLSYFKRLGVNAIELMPFSEFEGNESWGYNASFYFATDKYYGPKKDLQKFIDTAHANGIAIIQDIVLNHSYDQSPLVQLYIQNMEQNPWYNAVSPNPVYSWGRDFNHESLETQNFVDRVTLFWLREYKVDGFRFDFTKGFTNKPGDGSQRDNSRIAILKRMADKIWQEDSTAYVILEHFANNSEEKELADYGMMLWGNSNYNYNEATMGYNSSNKSDFSWASYKKRGWDNPHLVSYMESHDEERLMFKNLEHGNSSGNYNVKDFDTAIDRVKLAAAFFFTIPGPKMLWQFGELGYDFSIDYSGRIGNKPIRWDFYQDKIRRQLYNTFSAIINLKLQNPAFASRDFKVNFFPPVKKIHLNHHSMNVVIIGNFGVVQNSISPDFQHSGTWYDYFAGDSLNVQDTNKLLYLAPGEFIIYTDAKLTKPDLTTHIDKRKTGKVNVFKLENNYPNPFNPQTTFTFEIPNDSVVRVDIFDIQGRKLKTLTNKFQLAGEHTVSWNGMDQNGLPVSSGVYFYQIKAGNFTQSKKMTLLK
jgi:1,4-alpha-glucan branching enzyme